MAYYFADRQLQLPKTASELRQRLEESDEWWMNDAERCAIYALLSELRPACAIEVGFYRAGSLALLSRFSEKVYALDVDPTCETHCSHGFDNVTFVIGPAQITLPQVVARIAAAGEQLGFVLIDGEHSREGVKRDINSVLRYTPSAPLYIFIHDSFNPGCRKGIREADWSTNPHVHMVELDFVPGRFYGREDPTSLNKMWAGLALAILLPEPRKGDVLIHGNDALAYRTTVRNSAHRQPWKNPGNAWYQFTIHGKRFLRQRVPTLHEALRRRFQPR